MLGIPAEGPAACICTYFSVSDMSVAATWLLSVHLVSVSCDLASHPAHACYVSGSPSRTLTHRL